MDWKHRWIKIEGTGGWLIGCVVEDETFSPDEDSFNVNGRCPICGANAKKELDGRKRLRMEKIEASKKAEEIEKLNCLDGWC